MTDNEKGVRHVLGISGGKDSAALAVYMRDRVPEMEYFFTDTGAELPEVYDFLDRLEGYLGKPIARLTPESSRPDRTPFDELLDKYGGFLPSPNTRWCTRELKIKPFEAWVGEDEVFTYVAIRADEARDGYRSTKPNIRPVFPFKEDGIRLRDVERILDKAGIGLPEYYKWRSRSGCYFCFFQRKSEWVALAKEHPELFESAKAYEKLDRDTGERYTWSRGETLEELISRAADIRRLEIGGAQGSARSRGTSWQEALAADDDGDSDQAPCLTCVL